jgi:hypothetical protein
MEKVAMTGMSAYNSLLTKIAADPSHSTTESLLNDITIFELMNNQCRYFRQAVARYMPF